MDSRFAYALVTAGMAATGTLSGALDEVTMTLFALPADSGPRLPPHASGLFQLQLLLLLELQLRLAAGADVAGIPLRPLVEFGGFAGALCAAHMAALLANGGGCGDEHVVALVAGATDALARVLVDQLAARLGFQGEELLLLRLDLGGGGIGLGLLFGRRLLLGVAGALLAALVLAVGADLVGAVCGAAVVAGAVHAHADGLLNPLHADGLLRGGDPFVRLQGQAVLGEEGAGSLLLESAAVQLLVDDGLGIGLTTGGGRSGFRLGLRRGLGSWVGGTAWNPSLAHLLCRKKNSCI